MAKYNHQKIMITGKKYDNTKGENMITWKTIITNNRDKHYNLKNM